MNLTERLNKHLQNIKESEIKVKIDLQKLYKMVPNRNSNYIDKAIYELLLKPLAKGIESKKYIDYLERINNKSSYLDMIKAVYLEDIEILKDIKNTDRKIYNDLYKKYGPLNKDSVYNWFYDYLIEDNPIPEPSYFWYENSLDNKFKDLIEKTLPTVGCSAGFTMGQVHTIITLVELFWDRVDRLEDNESQQKALIKQLYK